MLRSVFNSLMLPRTAGMAGVLAVALGFSLSACRDQATPGAAADGGGTPEVTPVFRLVLHETDTLFLSSPGDFGFEPADGSFYITDQFAGRLLQIDRTGQITRTYGRKGSGPGEFAQ